MQTTKGDTEFLGIGVRMALLVGGAVTLINIVGGIWIYQSLRSTLVGETMTLQDAAAESLAPEFALNVRSLWREALSLSGVPPIAGIIRARRAGGHDALESSTEQQWHQRLAVTFGETLRANPDYLQARLIGVADGGREIVRVERSEKDILVAPRDQLQQKGHRPYFLATIRLLPGEVYLSGIDLNEEWGQVSEPHTPVIRAGVPVFDEEENIFGLVVIDLNLQRCFATMRSTLSRRYSLYLFNQQGDFAIHPDPGVAFGFQLGQPYGAEDEFPALLEKARDTPKPVAVVSSPRVGRVVASMRRLYADPGDPNRWWGLLLTSDYKAVTGASAQQANEFILFSILLLAVTLATVFAVSRHVTQPLRKITQAVEAYARQEPAVDLPLEARDEAGVLARAFSDLLHERRKHDAALLAEVAERRRAEAALRRSEQRLHLALAAAEAGVWRWDAGANKVYWDRSMEKLFGNGEGPFDGTLQSWSRTVHPEDWRALEARLLRSSRSDEAFSLGLRVRANGAGWRHLKVHGTACGDGAGRTGVIGVCWDISDEKAAQQRIEHYAQQLEQKNRETEELVYSVSHDLKAPLVTCKGFLGILREDLGEGRTGQALASIQRLEGASRKMTCLIEDLLQFSRVGRVTEIPERIDVSSLVRELIDEARAQACIDGVQIVVQPDMPDIEADPTAISRLFQNLLANAFKYGVGAPSARIEVGGNVHEGEVRFFVRDNGCGIPKQYQHKIFGLFQRLDTTQEGSGIGLAVVSKIMSTYKGRAWIESGAGEGAAFWLAFPLQLLAPAPADSIRSTV